MAAINAILFITLLMSFCQRSSSPPNSNYIKTMNMALSNIKGHIYRKPPQFIHHSKGSSVFILTLILAAGDVASNPGPRNTSTYPCGLFDMPVTWQCEGVACDECSVWHHRSCLELCSADYELLHRSNVQWLCCKCDSINVNSFTFRSYETDSNFYAPIQGTDITLDSINSSVFSPLKSSSPKIEEPRSRSIAGSSKSRTSSSVYHKKMNLRIFKE